ncbi:hypothetical protein FRB95_004028, partial [Tulasnella sp. JGI-2019a]
MLLGQAGTGKSAIASSIANRGKESQRLGAVFHFTRDEQPRNKGAILVLARQLARWGEHRLRSKIASAIDSAVQDGLDVAQMAPENQFQQLIQQPLVTLDSISPTLVIVLDALDECDDAYATTLLRLFGKLLDKLPHQIKLFITSRGEPHLQEYYDSDPLKSQVEKHSMVDEKMERVEEDISAYFKERLPRMVGRWVAQPSNWPGDDKRQALVHKTQGLFICATTVAGMLADSNFRDPEAQLEGILSSNNIIHLDNVYAQILNRACPISSRTDLLALFRNVLGTLVVARVPINTHTLASLLSPDGVEQRILAYRIRGTVLAYLQAVLIIPDIETSEVTQDAHPIRFIHTSFVDYLTDKSRCEPRFLLNLNKQHEQLAIGCLRRMRGLKYNMCDLDPSRLNSEVEDLEQRIRDHLSPGLQYACAQISVHLSQTSADSAEVRSLMEEFAEVRLLNWLEVLSLMGMVSQAVGMASQIESWVKQNLYPDPIALVPSSIPASLSHSLNSPHSHLTIPVHLSDNMPGSEGSAVVGKRAKVKHFLRKIVACTPSPVPIAHTPVCVPSPIEIISRKANACTVEIFHDLQRFIMAFMEPIIASSLHIYYSALMFTPSKTELLRQYGHFAQHSIRVVRGYGETWPQALWTARKHSGSVNCIAMSPDGMTIVSGSSDRTLHLWDVKTGAAIGNAMKGHTSPVISITFLDDGKHIISMSLANEILAWNHITGTQLLGIEAYQTMGMSQLSFTLDARGWVLGEGGKHIFCLPADLRGDIASQ